MPTVYQTFVRSYAIRDVLKGDGAFIQTVDVERATDKSVFINGRRQAKVSDYNQFHDTWEEAYSFLMKEAIRRHENAARALSLREIDLADLRNLKA